MQAIFFLIFAFVGLILQGGNIANYIALGEHNIKPDFLVVLMVFFSLRMPSVPAIISSFVLGFGSDLVLLPMGPFMIAYTIAGSLISPLRKTPIAISYIAQSFLVFVSTLLLLGGANLIKFIANYEIPSDLVFRISMISLYSAIISPFVFVLLDFVAVYFGFKKQS